MSHAEFTLRIFPDLEAVSCHAAELFRSLSRESIISSGRFIVALAGGATPQRLYSVLSSGAYRDTILWKDVHFFWGDERFVPRDHKDSNYLPAFRNLLSGISVSSRNIHAIDTSTGSPDLSAERYELDIRTFFHLKEDELPRFDLILLGIGRDGHTASLFPGNRVLAEEKRLAAPVAAPSPVNTRITLTLPVINNARTVIFLASGEEKASILPRIIEGHDLSLPASLVDPRNGRLIFLIDEKAAGLLQRR